MASAEAKVNRPSLKSGVCPSPSAIDAVVERLDVVTSKDKVVFLQAEHDGAIAIGDWARLTTNFQRRTLTTPARRRYL